MPRAAAGSPKQPRRTVASNVRSHLLRGTKPRHREPEADARGFKRSRTADWLPYIAGRGGRQGRPSRRRRSRSRRPSRSATRTCGCVLLRLESFAADRRADTALRARRCATCRDQQRVAPRVAYGRQVGGDLDPSAPGGSSRRASTHVAAQSQHQVIGGWQRGRRLRRTTAASSARCCGAGRPRRGMVLTGSARGRRRRRARVTAA